MTVAFDSGPCRSSCTLTQSEAPWPDANRMGIVEAGALVSAFHRPRLPFRTVTSNSFYLFRKRLRLGEPNRLRKLRNQSGAKHERSSCDCVPR